MLEQKSRDGIPQITIGIFLILVAVLIFLRRESMTGILIILIPMVTRTLRRRFTYPRIGYAKLPDNATQRGLFMWIIAGILVLGLILFLVTTRPGFSPQAAKNLYFGTMYGIAAVVVTLLVVRYLKEKDYAYLLYAGALLLTIVLVWYYHLKIRTVMYIIAGFGVVNLLYGVFALRSFIRSYPVLEEDPK